VGSTVALHSLRDRHALSQLWPRLDGNLVFPRVIFERRLALIKPARFYVGVTDAKWFRFLRDEPLLDEVNFWSPGRRRLNAERGTPFLFKLKSPENVIGGGAFVSFVQRMPIRDAWEFFRRENGAATLEELRLRIEANRKSSVSVDDEIGCFVLSQPFFFSNPVAQPEDWSGAIQGGKYYYLTDSVAQRVWRDVAIALTADRPRVAASPFGGYGTPAWQPTRLGQGAFRKLVLDAYERRCAVSGEHTVPVLQASHIKPFADVAQHEITNGLALRSDIHTLFDLGYVTVTPDYRFKVSEQLREDFDNGEVYYEYAERKPTIFLPSDGNLLPDREHLEWHAKAKFRG
jgi:putative restriction endonuclease